MSMEIERKWRVLAFAAGAAGTTCTAGRSNGRKLRQGYLATGADEVRIRDQGGDKTLTCKQGQGLVRREYEITLSSAQFDALWVATEGRRIEKTRYTMQHGDHVIEVDVYEGALTGLVVAEVEFADRADAETFAPPAWFGPELTGNKAWSNARLAIDGAPNDALLP